CSNCSSLRYSFVFSPLQKPCEPLSFLIHRETVRNPESRGKLNSEILKRRHALIRAASLDGNRDIEQPRPHHRGARSFAAIHDRANDLAHLGLEIVHEFLGEASLGGTGNTV